MYDSIKDLLLEFFRAPGSPPEPPAGAHASLRIFRASPHFLSYQLLMLNLVMLAVLLVILILGGILMANEALLGVVALVLMIILWGLAFGILRFVIRLEYDMRYYVVTDRSLRIRKGVWTIIEQTLTFVNIQNVKVEQGPLERVYGISRLVVDTAGGGGSASQDVQAHGFRNYHQAVLNGLENAEEIRDLIIDYLKTLPHAVGLGHPEDYGESGLSRRSFTSAETDALREILQETQALRAHLVRE